MLSYIYADHFHLRPQLRICQTTTGQTAALKPSTSVSVCASSNKFLVQRVRRGSLTSFFPSSPRTVRAPVDAEALDAEKYENDAKVASEFAPAFVYPIFGEEEQIYGYRDLDVKVRARALSLVFRIVSRRCYYGGDSSTSRRGRSSCTSASTMPRNCQTRRL